MESYLDKIVEYLKQYPVQLSRDTTASHDGRVDSIKNEDEVIAKIKTNPELNDIVEPAKIREFCDFTIKKDEKHIYVNIKVSDFNNNATDNCSSKKGLGYALTGKTDLPGDYKKFHEAILNNIKPGYDYYFLVVNKNDPSDLYWTSLKRIERLASNGNNPPFQCNWAINRKPSSRTEEEATRYLLETYVGSWNKRIDGYPFKIKKKLDDKSTFLNH